MNVPNLADMRQHANGFFMKKARSVFREDYRLSKFMAFYYGMNRSSPYACEAERSFWRVQFDPTISFKERYNEHLENEWKKYIAEYTKKILLGEIK